MTSATAPGHCQPHPLASAWPLFGVRIVTPRIELRLPDDRELEVLAEVAAAGVHPVGDMPFGSPWTDAPSPEREYGVLRNQWNLRGAWTPSSWTLQFVVFLDGQPIGCQDLGATNFAVRRVVGTASWLGQRWHGRGLGTEMRQAVLRCAFDGLGALAATTDAYEDNLASIGVNRRCGYRPNGRMLYGRRRGELGPDGECETPMWADRFIMEPPDWAAHRPLDIELHGISDEVRLLCGAG